MPYRFVTWATWYLLGERDRVGDVDATFFRRAIQKICCVYIALLFR